MQRSDHQVAGCGALSFVGRSKERRQVEDAIHHGQSVLVLGPPGSGKTALVRSVTESVTGAVYVGYRPVLHDMLASLATALAANGGDRCFGAQTSVHLRGLLWHHFKANPCLLILDGIHRASFPAYRFFQRVYHSPGMAMIAISRNLPQLGHLHRLFWDPRQTIQMMPLSDADARTLFKLAAEHFGLHQFDLADFQPRVLESAQGNPGQIVEMCRMALDPQYRSGRHVLFAPLRIDAMARYLD